MWAIDQINFSKLTKSIYNDAVLMYQIKANYAALRYVIPPFCAKQR